jgi:soluble lytic murein transglycosylase-like protein
VTLWAVLDTASTDTATLDGTAPGQPQNQDGASLADEFTSMARQTLNLWRPPEKYALLIATAEARHGLPQDLLSRLLYQECRWREDIISGRLTSPAGAVGIAQIMPATAAEWGVNPLDPASAIDGAARYLSSLYSMFGTWTKALAAYNWGPGNVSRKGLGMAPAETLNYYSQILSDVNAADGSNLA